EPRGERVEPVDVVPKDRDLAVRWKLFPIRRLKGDVLIIVEHGNARHSLSPSTTGSCEAAIRAHPRAIVQPRPCRSRDRLALSSEGRPMSDRLPIKIDSTSNGEFRPVPLDPELRAARRLASERIADNARRTGASRRAFMMSLCGAATALLAFDEVFAATGRSDGAFLLPKEAALEPAAAEATLAGREFVFDVQTHMVDVAGAWRRRPEGRQWERALAGFPQGSCGEADPVACFSAERFVKEVFVDSDTRIAVLSFVPGLPEDNPLSIAEALRVRGLVEQLEGSDRLLLHAPVVPNAPGEIARMDKIAGQFKVAAWKVYTQWGPERIGWRLDDPRIGIPFIEEARRLGIRNIAIHKGLPFSGMPLEFATCADVGPAARLFPDVNFIIYHSGFETGRREGPYDATRAERGIDALVKSLADNGIGPGANVYAE